MKRSVLCKIINSLVSSLLLVALSVTCAAAEEQPLSESISQLTLRINQLRQNPLDVLQQLGVDLQDARTALGDDGWVLDAGLPALRVQSKLEAAATAHVWDMFENNYYSFLSLDGQTPRERLEAATYPVDVSVETLLALAFTVPVDLDRVVDAMFLDMVNDELYSKDPAQRALFSTEVSEMGIALQGGDSPLFSGNPYAYLLVIDFARPLEQGQANLSSPARFLWRQINETRANPLAAVRRLGLDESLVRQTLGDDSWLLDAGLPPLAWHELLHASALQASLLSRESLESTGRNAVAGSVLVRIRATGYRTDTAEEISDMRYVPVAQRGQAAENVFSKQFDGLLVAELTGKSNRPRLILSDEMTEIGISPQIVKAEVFADGGLVDPRWPDIYLLVADFSRPLQLRPQVVGHVSVPGQLLLLTHVEEQQSSVVVGEWGTFQFPMPRSGTYELFVLNDQSETIATTPVLQSEHESSRYVEIPSDL